MKTIRTKRIKSEEVKILFLFDVCETDRIYQTRLKKKNKINDYSIKMYVCRKILYYFIVQELHNFSTYDLHEYNEIC